MIASVPLIVAGYPMINIDLDGRAEYYEAIRKVSYWAVTLGAPLTAAHPGTRGRSRTVDEVFL